MTPETLLKLRKDRGMTREELAEFLGCSASAIVQWEGNKRAIPSWVAEKMLVNTEITLPLTELEELLNLAKEEGISFAELLKESCQLLLATRRERKQPKRPKIISLGAHIAPENRAAEDTPGYGEQ